MRLSIRIAMACFTCTWIGVAERTLGETPPPQAQAAPATSGEAAGIGAWTTDWPAAVKVAQERKLPLFVQFTGSDWCGWCQKMEKECFSKAEFLEAMKTRCVLVVVDFPHKTKLPDALKTQNDALAAQYKRRGGFPGYYMVDADTKSVHWSWGANPKYGQDLKLLVSDIENFVAGCACVVERATKDLPAAKAEAYRKAAKAYAEKQWSIVEWIDEKHPDAKAARVKFDAALEELKTLKAAMEKVLANHSTAN